MITAELGPFIWGDSKNNLNKIVLSLNPLLLEQDDQLYIKINGSFIAGYILILFGYYLKRLTKNFKNIKIDSDSKVLSFLNESGFIGYLNTGNFNIGRTSVLLPFCNFNGHEKLKDFSKYFEKYHNSLPEYFYKYPLELFDNSFSHGNSNNICTLSQLYPNIGRMDFTIFDDGVGILQNSINRELYVKQKINILLNDSDKFIKKYGLKLIIIILCVSTTYSTRLNGGGNGLFELSKFLFDRKGIMNIYTWTSFITIKFNNICTNGKLSFSDIEISENEVTFLDGTYINFKFDK